jgi:hypothetical protein
MTPPRTRRRPLACVMTAAALAAGALIAATAVVPQRARAQDSGTQAAPRATAADGVGPEAGAGGSGWCARIPPGFGHPPANLTPLALRVLDPSIEPVQTTDGLIHLAYIAQVTNTQTTPADIASVVPVDALAGFAPTGRNSPTDAQGDDVAGQVELFATAQFPSPSATPSFTASVPAGNSGLMFFDVTYTDPAQIPRLLAHAITLASPNGDGGPGTPALTDPVPVGCKKLAVLHPPLVGQGWLAAGGCCTLRGLSSHRRAADQRPLAGRRGVRHRLHAARAGQHLLPRPAPVAELLVGLRHPGPGRRAGCGRGSRGRPAGPAARGHDRARPAHRGLWRQ